MVYAIIVGGFTAAYLVSGAVANQALPGVPQVFDALPTSLSAVHARVVFARFHLDTVQSWPATGESIGGSVAEGVVVAMLIQRFFGR